MRIIEMSSLKGSLATAEHAQHLYLHAARQCRGAVQTIKNAQRSCTVMRNTDKDAKLIAGLQA